jgi:hypothetical protein
MEAVWLIRRRSLGAGRIQREALRAAGIHDTWCVDSHEKLSCLALNMGDVSIEFTAYCDKWSHYLLKLDTLPRCRDEDDAAHVLLDVILEQGGARDAQWSLGDAPLTGLQASLSPS